MRAAALSVALLASGASLAQTDTGRLDAPDTFAYVGAFADRVGLSGEKSVEIRAPDRASAADVEQRYADMYPSAVAFLTRRHLEVSTDAPPVHVQIRVVRVEDMNDPRNFSGADARCMRRPRDCRSGAYVGLTSVRGPRSLVVYVSHGLRSPLACGFEATVVHELMHVILRRQLLTFGMDEAQEHALIDAFVRAYVPRTSALARSVR